MRNWLWLHFTRGGRRLLRHGFRVDGFARTPYRQRRDGEWVPVRRWGSD